MVNFELVLSSFSKAVVNLSAPSGIFSDNASNAVLRHTDNKKWYAILMKVSRSKLGLSGDETVDILDIKCDPLMSGSLLMENGIFPGYHMHKGNWLTVLLDGTVGLKKNRVAA